MNLKQLSEKLADVLAKNPEYAELEVETEGCDCWGDTKGGVFIAKECDDEQVILIGRGDYPAMYPRGEKL